jgi:hypothetical protein
MQFRSTTSTDPISSHAVNPSENCFKDNWHSCGRRNEFWLQHLKVHQENNFNYVTQAITASAINWFEAVKLL